jgi:alpha-galactosidase
MRYLLALLVLPWLSVSFCRASVDTDATIEARRWVAAKFLDADRPDPPVKPFLQVRLAPNSLMRDYIEGHPLLISAEHFDNGLAMRSPGEILVHIPAGARTFEAKVGVDSNDVFYDSNVGRGSVVASIEAGGREFYQSPTLREGMKSIPIHVDLHGEREFVLRLRAVGERSPVYQAEWDQADWANASVIQNDGSRLSLSKLPLGEAAQAFSHAPPFSFRYGENVSADFLKSWSLQRRSRQIDQERTEYTLVYRDPSTHLSVRCVGIAYRDFPTIEWTVYFKNEGQARTPILQDIQGLDADFDGEATNAAILHHSEGSSAAPTDYQPLETTLTPKANEHFASRGGRPTDGNLPYFNLAFPGHGVIFVIGWPGQWSVDVAQDQSNDVHVSGGQESTHFWLAPGEEVRTPLCVVQFWDGDWIDGQNLWRRWMVAYNLPRPGGQLPRPFLASGSSRFTLEMQGANEENQKEFIAGVVKLGIPINHWWMDAGWYPFTKGWWQTGTWYPDPKRFPQGLRPISDFAHARHLKVVLWFEPERVTAGSWLDQNHPEWLLGADGKDKLLFLGNPQARKWLVDHVSQMIVEQGLDVYRQDFNFAPLELWKWRDTKDREGITEIEDVEGYLAYFDELQRRFPSLLIDTCASGGRRNDLETLRRAVPLDRSDYLYEPISQQGHTFGLSLWVPFFGTALNSFDPYTFRSQMAPAISLGMNPEQMASGQLALKHLLAQWHEVTDFYYGDFVPLVPYSMDSSAWMAWEFSRPESGTGVVQVFRRENSPFSAAQFKLRNLEPAARYIVKNLDTSQEVEFSGKQLMEVGLPVSIRDEPGAVIFMYGKDSRAVATSISKPVTYRAASR